jgi:lysophospholipase L1-like esterase/azurin
MKPAFALALIAACLVTARAQLPLELKQGEHIVLIGNTLFERMRDHGQFEAMLQQRFSGKELILRNLAWSADEITLRPRPDGFGDLHQHLTEQKADVILAAFGFNESFKGIAALPEFEILLKSFLIELRSHRYNGTGAPRIVLVSPIAVESLGLPLPLAAETNVRLQAYTAAMRKVAKEEGVGFVDVFAATLEPTTAARKKGVDVQRTDNGIHLNDVGYTFFAEALYQGLLQETAPQVVPAVRAAVEEKEKQFFYRHRPLNGYYITGGRADPYGVVNFPGEMKKLDQMVASRDAVIWGLAQGKAVEVDDSNLPPLPVITGDRPINEWHTPEDELKAFKIDPRFEVNCFVSEEDFPEFMKPIQMRWDTKGRLWVSTSVTYPQILPGDEPQDKILILEDTNHDGRADKCSVWADKLQIPLSFEFGDGGVYCSEQPNLIFLKDTDGDGKADLKKIVLSGFGTEDSHHALHDFVWSPEGDLIFRESIFHHSQVETPYGPVRARESSFFRFTPATRRLQAFGSYMSTNPWGITFDDWGFHVGSHPVFASAVHALNPAYPDIHVPAGSYFPAYSGTCGQEFLSSKHWPNELRGTHFMRARYKPTNEIELHQWIEKDSHFEEKKVGIVFQSTDLSFIPVDVNQGPDGAMYICDWYNPIKGHMQYSLRDTRRDKKSGRIWRITAKGQPLEEAPKIAGATIPALLELLKSGNYRTRYRAKIELRDRDAKAVIPQLLSKLDPNATSNGGETTHDLIELLWLTNAVLSTQWDASRFSEHIRKPSASSEEKTFDSLAVAYFGRIMKLAEEAEPLARASAVRMLAHAATQETEFSHRNIEEARNSNSVIFQPVHLSVLKRAANDSSGLVRLQAAIAASYIGTQEALEAALDLLKHPMDDYLTYALRTALDSYTLKPLWKDNVAFAEKHPELGQFLIGSEPKKPAVMARKKKAEKADPFDQQPGLISVTIKAIPERLLFDVREFKVKAGAPVKLTFENPDVTPHNLLVVQPGAADEVGMAGNEMAKLPDGMARGFVPDNPKILQRTKLLNQGTEETLRFKAPSEPGRYPYICTFPGHWLVMKGEMVVE